MRLHFADGTNESAMSATLVHTDKIHYLSIV